jgi:hypothetical protein
MSASVRVDEIGISEIVLERFRGFGPSPDFQFTARSNETYDYDGRWHVELLGKKSGKFPDYLFERLAELCSDLKILELADIYPDDFDDVPIMILTVRHAGGVKVVRNEAGGTCPPRLWGFAIVVEYAMQQAFRTEKPKRRGKK